jgi:hypothetical protein
MDSLISGALPLSLTKRKINSFVKYKTLAKPRLETNRNLLTSLLELLTTIKAKECSTLEMKWGS